MLIISQNRIVYSLSVFDIGQINGVCIILKEKDENYKCVYAISIIDYLIPNSLFLVMA